MFEFGSDIIIRDVQEQDNAALIELVNVTLEEFGAQGPGYAMSDPELLDMFSNYQLQGKHYYVVEKCGEVLGGAGIAPLDGEEQSGICELRKMYFLPKLRGMGVGKALIDICIIKAKKTGYHSIYLETIDSMEIAQNLYKSRGFDYLQNRKGNTGHSACKVFMMKKITPWQK